MSVRLFKSLIIIGMLLAMVTASFNLRPLSRSYAQDPQNPPTQKIESDDARVVQSGTWSTQATRSASAGNYLFSSGSEADILSLAFEGSALEILYSAGPSLGTLAIEVDGTVLRTVITTDTETRYGQSAKINYLTDEPHTLKVYAQAGGIIAIDAFVITPVESSTEPSGELVAVSAAPPTELRNCPFVDNALQRMSVGVGNIQATNYSFFPDISADGRYVAFASFANNLVAGDTNNKADAFLLDRQTCNLTRIAMPSEVWQSPYYMALSDDAENLLFAHTSTDVGFPHCYPGMPCGNIMQYRLWAYNRLNGTSTQLRLYEFFSSHHTHRVDFSLISNRYVLETFTPIYATTPPSSYFPNLRLGDLTTGNFNNINVGPGGTFLAGARNFSISDDGRHIGFVAEVGSAPIPNCVTTIAQVMIYDTLTQSTQCVSRASDGTLANLGGNQRPLLSANGRFIAFASDATNLVPDDTNNLPDIFVRDLQTGQTERISDSIAPMNTIRLEDFSPSGHSVIYSAYTPRSTDPTGYNSHTLYMVDRQTHNVTTLPASSINTSYVPIAALSADGSRVVFQSDSPNLVTDDTNGVQDIFMVPGVSNPVVPAVGDALALFRPDLNAFSLGSTLQDLPPVGAFDIYTTNAPAEATTGTWVMGDWNGDGEDTPGAYAPNGVFYYTNESGAGTGWNAIWIGLLGRPPVAGRFDAAVNHDCIGVVDSANFPPHGTAFALYFTCGLTDGAPTTLAFQWLSVLLPDAGGFSGTHQFAAGDFNNDGVDSIAVRRGEFISFGNVPPTTLLSEFSMAQYWGVPSVTGGEAGIFLAGDFDNTAGDSFGVFYQNGHFYYRNSVEWSPAGHLLQRVGQPIGTPVQATSWR